MMKKSRLEIRLTDDQKDQLQHKAEKAGLTVSQLVLDAALGVEVKSVRGPKKADPQLLASIARVGNLLNQIARQANQGDLTALVRLASIDAQLKAISDAH